MGLKTKGPHRIAVAVQSMIIPVSQSRRNLWEMDLFLNYNLLLWIYFWFESSNFQAWCRYEGSQCHEHFLQCLWARYPFGGPLEGADILSRPRFAWKFYQVFPKQWIFDCWWLFQNQEYLVVPCYSLANWESLSLILQLQHRWLLWFWRPNCHFGGFTSLECWRLLLWILTQFCAGGDTSYVLCLTEAFLRWFMFS